MIKSEATDPLLLAVAMAMVDNPRASLQELAKAVGVSKATLYRMCPTRDKITERLFSESVRQFDLAIAAAELETAPIPQAFRALIEGHLRHKELFVFVSNTWEPQLLEASDTEHRWAEYEAIFDQFFLRGQQEGFFRVDIGAAALSELMIGMLSALVNSERSGRIARKDMLDTMEKMFLTGAKRSVYSSV